MTTRWARVARGVVTAVISTFIAAFSHAVAEGSLPGVAGIALTLAFATIASVLLAGRALSALRLSIAVAASQFMFHAVFGLLTDAVPGVSPPSTAVHNHAMVPALLAEPSHSGTTMNLSGSLFMWSGHAIAAALTVAVLLHAERAFWSFGEITALTLRRLFAIIVHVIASCPPRRSAIATHRASLPHYRTTARDIHRHRGPPVSLAL